MEKILVGQHKKFCLFLFFFALLIRVLFFGLYLCEGERSIIQFDGQQYQNVAENIIAGYGVAQAPGVPNFYRLPGYPMFLALCYKIFGVQNLDPEKIEQEKIEKNEKALWVQLVLASVIPVLVFLLSLILLPGYLGLAKVAGLWAAVHTGFILYAGMLASESLFLIFFLLFMCLFFSQFYTWLEYTNNPPKFSCLSWVSIGFILGIASLLRAVGHYIIILLILMMLIAGFSQKEKIKSLGLLFLGWLSVVGWWLARNYFLTGFMFFHVLPGLHFLQYPAVHAIMGYSNFGDSAYFETKKQVLAEWDDLIKQQELLEHRTLNEYERYAVAEQLAFSHLKQRPVIALKNGITQIVRSCCTLYSSLLLYVPAGTVYEKDASLWFKIKLYLSPKTHEPWIIWLVYWEVIYFLFMCVGLLIFCIRLFWDQTYRILALKTFPIIGLFIFITLGYGCARLRFPIEPLLIIISLVGLQSLVYPILRKKKS